MRCEHLSDEEVLSTVTRLAGRERETLVAIVSLIREVEARKLHLREAFSSIYDFCFRALKLSEGEASRRVHVARMSKRCPQVLDALRSGAVNLTNLALMHAVMTPENADDLLAAATNKPKSMVEMLVATLAPKPDVPSDITRLRDGAQPNDGYQPPPKPLSPGRFRIQTTGDEELCALIERGLRLTRHENPKGDMALLFKEALKKLVPTLEKEKLGKGVKPREAKPPRDPSDISAATRREVLARDEAQCAYVSPTGVRCPARDWLEVDHRHARAHGGEGTIENLRVLCRAHNQYEAEKTFGRAHIEKKVAERRAANDPASDPKIAPPTANDPASDPKIARPRAGSAMPSTTSPARATLKSALVGLGFRAKEVDMAIATFADEHWARPIEQLLRDALGRLTP